MVKVGFSGDPMLNLISRCAGKPHLHVRDFMQLPIRDYVVEIVSCNNDGIEGRWSFFGKDSDDSKMRCLKSISGMGKVNLIELSSKLYEFINRVSIEIHEIHTDLNDAAMDFTCNWYHVLHFAISNSCELNDFWHCIHKWM